MVLYILTLKADTKQIGFQVWYLIIQKLKVGEGTIYTLNSKNEYSWETVN